MTPLGDFGGIQLKTIDVEVDEIIMKERGSEGAAYVEQCEANAIWYIKLLYVVLIYYII